MVIGASKHISTDVTVAIVCNLIWTMMMFTFSPTHSFSQAKACFNDNQIKPIWFDVISG